MRLSALVALALTCGCASTHFSGQLDLTRVEKGEIFVEVLPLPGGSGMQHCVATVDAPSWQVLNALLRIEDYPLWHPAFGSSEILQRDGELPTEVLMTLKPIAGMQFTPMKNRLRTNLDRGEISITYFETDWIRNGQTVLKVTPLREGNRTMLTLYSTGDIKFDAGLPFVVDSKDRLAQMVINLRKAMSWPQFAERRAWKPAARTHVVVPNFRAEGASDTAARALTRVFAEQLMSSGKYDVTTPQEQAALLHYGSQQSLIGCDPNQPCGVDLGKVLGAQKIVAGTVSQLGSRYLLTVALMTVETGAIDGRASGEAASEEALMKAVPEVVGKLSAL